MKKSGKMKIGFIVRLNELLNRRNWVLHNASTTNQPQKYEEDPQMQDSKKLQPTIVKK